MKNKSAYLRYRIIDQCLNNKFRKFTRMDLQEFIIAKLDLKGLSVSTIDKDLRAMREELDAPIKTDPVEKYYYYENEFTLASVNLREEEESILRSSVKLLDVLKETAYARSYRSSIERMVIVSQNESTSKSIVEFEQPVFVKGIEWFDRLYRAVKEQIALVVSYRPYGKETRSYHVSPYLIKEFRNRFYLIARRHDSLNDTIYSMALDRIMSLDVSDQSFIQDLDFRPEQHFKYSFGITTCNDKQPMDLVLKFDKKNKPYILSNPIHHSQKILTDIEDVLTISINVCESDELNIQILGYGEGVEVVSPDSYRNHIRHVAMKMCRIYG